MLSDSQLQDKLTQWAEDNSLYIGDDQLTTATENELMELVRAVARAAAEAELNALIRFGTVGAGTETGWVSVTEIEGRAAALRNRSAKAGEEHHDSK